MCCRERFSFVCYHYKAFRSEKKVMPNSITPHHGGFSVFPAEIKQEIFVHALSGRSRFKSQGTARSLLLTSKALGAELRKKSSKSAQILQQLARHHQQDSREFVAYTDLEDDIVASGVLEADSIDPEKVRAVVMAAAHKAIQLNMPLDDHIVASIVGVAACTAFRCGSSWEDAIGLKVIVDGKTIDLSHLLLERTKLEIQQAGEWRTNRLNLNIKDAFANIDSRISKSTSVEKARHDFIMGLSANDINSSYPNLGVDPRQGGSETPTLGHKVVEDCVIRRDIEQGIPFPVIYKLSGKSEQFVDNLQRLTENEDVERRSAHEKEKSAMPNNAIIPLKEYQPLRAYQWLDKQLAWARDWP